MTTERKKKSAAKAAQKKSLTIRYNPAQEKEIEEMCLLMNEKTMSKAFLRAPDMLRNAAKKIQYLEQDKLEQQREITELRSVLSAYSAFSERLDAFVNKKTGDKDEGNKRDSGKH